MSGAVVIANADKALRLLEAGCSALAEARTVADAKKIRDQAAAVQHYLSQQKLSVEAQQDAAELKVRAERRLGELLPPRKPGPNSSHDATNSDEPPRWERHRWQKVAQVPNELFEDHLRACREERDEITTAGVMKLAKKARKSATADASRYAAGSTIEDLNKAVEAGQTFGCIYADPPWRYGNQGTRASTDNHYPTMTVAEIAALPVGKLAAPQAHLWLWTTNGFLFECPRLFEVWGFEFKSSYVWVKPQIGIGNYLRNSHEFLLLAVRGGLVGQASDVRSWGEFDRARHSAKPEKIRTEVVERVSPGPYLELFARQKVAGWSVWGNEVAPVLF